MERFAGLGTRDSGLVTANAQAARGPAFPGPESRVPSPGPMLPELGQILLILALLAALLQAALPLAGAQRGDARWMAVARP
ncbi:hypothetical protein, partial [Xanthomonas translucens]|uniref:hypothetical protein n=1 Tax=Xanthomonas campestris pv. translucens TaxID=343 RepID=UPI001E5561A5